MVAPGGVMHGCYGGACVVALGGHVWLLWGVCMVAPGGTCVVAMGGMCGCSGEHAWLLRGACMAAPGGMCGCSQGGHAWLLLGGMHGCSGGCTWLLWGVMCGCSQGGAWLLWGVCVVALGGMHGFFDEIRSMSGRYASYWNAFFSVLSLQRVFHYEFNELKLQVFLS